MDNKKIIDIILQDTYTKADAIRRLRILRMMLETKLFSQESSIDQKIKNLNISDEDASIVKNWLQKCDSLFNQENVYKLLNNISISIDKLPNIIFYIAQNIQDPKYLSKITAWVREFVSRDALIDLKIDPKKVGGLAFVQKGIIQDYSLAYFMKQKKHNILDMIGTYATK